MDKLLSFGTTIPEINYPTNRQDIPSIEYVQFEAGERKQETLRFTEIILVTEGYFLLSYDHFLDQKIEPGKILLLPPGCHFSVRTEERASALIIRIKEAIYFCQEHSIRHIPEIEEVSANRMNCLDIKPAMEKFISFLKDYLERGLIHEQYLTLKVKELLYLLRFYYTAEELKGFFLPLLSSDVQFHLFVLRYYRKVKTVKEFAELHNCSISNFDKKFHQTFGTSTFQWMQQQKIKLLYHEINATNKSLGQIAKEQKFLSLPQFNDYCKKHFGYPPGRMRKLSSMFRIEKSFL